MKPSSNWTKDWRYGLEPRLEMLVAGELLIIFQAFWDWFDLDAKSKSTKQRYAAALHALGA
ncbi:MAG: hypothetical protein P8163_07630 [Candidatus Thiodiazotropha sp.]